MRGTDSYNEALFSIIRLEGFVSANQPLSSIHARLNEALTKMKARF